MTPGSDDRWRVWQRRTAYGDALRRRASGELPEMDSAVAAAKYVATFLRRGDEILDVGAGAGHYLRSLERLLPEPFSYTAVDATLSYLDGAARDRGDEGRAMRAVAGDIYRLPFRDRSADLALCCNVLLHLPSIAQPFRELVRVARGHVLVRTLVGERGFLIKEVEGDDLSEHGDPSAFNWYNIYPRAYVERLLRSMPRVRDVRIVEDRAYSPERIEAAARDSGAVNATRIVGGWQVNGYVLQPWHFVHVVLDGPADPAR